MEVVARGAEAILYREKYEGEEVLIKERIEKRYRIKELDKRIRKSRTREEARLMIEARKVGVLTPKIIKVDEDGCKIVMEFLEGTRVKEFLEKASKKDVEKVSQEIGRYIAKLHERGIVHGDLTTSNMILKEGKLYFIDFGLGAFSKRIEDQGVDLNVLFESIKSTHFKILKTCWRNILKGYREIYKDAEKVLKRMEEIEIRARYKERKNA